MPLDSTLTLFWISLGISAAAVVIFLWLVRKPRGERKDDGQRRSGLL